MIELRRLGRSGLEVSPLGLGIARIAGLGWRDDLVPNHSTQAKRDAIRQIQAAVELGVRLFDTADNYGQGLSECILGEALRGCREGIVVVNGLVHLEYLQNELVQWFGTKVKIAQKGKRGKIIIEFYSPEELDRIIEKIKGMNGQPRI